jgi:K+-transporting ATPase ATPase A chain
MLKEIIFLWGSYGLLVLGGGFFLGKILFKIFSAKTIGFEEKLLKVMGIDAVTPMNWKEYLFSLLFFSLMGIIFLQFILMFQHILPLNTDGKVGLPFWMSFNIAASFVTNTNWQNYAGESTLSNFSQMAGLTVQNFLSAATGISVMLVLVRGILKKETTKLGNFWSDLTRATFRFLLPLSIILTIILISLGVPQTLSEKVSIQTLEGKESIIPVGPVASQVSIKMVGTNGGGFFNANAAHPFENPNPLANYISLLFILLVPVACVFLFIFMMPKRSEGYLILSVMSVLLLLGMGISLWATLQTNPSTGMSFIEGKDTRISLAECSLWSVTTTAVSNGSINCAHSSLAPFSQLVALFNMMTGEIIFGGAGTGIYTMLLYVFLTVFLAGLMVGRTPEYLGKKIEAHEIIWVGFALLTPGLLNLILSAFTLNSQWGLPSLSHLGPHGLSEVLYAFSSLIGNNGSAFAGLNSNTPFFNITGGFAMLFGRFAVIISVFIIAGSMGKKNISPPTLGTLKTNTPIFGFLLISVVIIMGALTFFPTLILGPIAEHLLMNQY